MKSKKIIFGLLILSLVILTSAFVLLFQRNAFDEITKNEAEKLGIVVPTFTEIPFEFSHSWNKTEALPFAGASLIDLSSDGKIGVFTAGGFNQKDALFYFDNGEFKDLSNDNTKTRKTDKPATYGSLSIDIDNDNDTDLIVARNEGLFLHRKTNGDFVAEQIPLNIPARAVPVAITAGDINHDNLVDLYVSTFINQKDFVTATYNVPEHATPNVLLVQNPDGSFTDSTEKSGITAAQNTFLSSFIDFNNDGWLDLVVAENTGKVRIFKNNEGKFAEQKSPTEFGFWMGIAAGDIDNDGDVDLLLSNTVNTVPKFGLKGDLKDDQILDKERAFLRNEGDFNFTRIPINGEFGWGAVFEDFNLDGELDIIVAENYIKWIGHKIRKTPGRLLIQKDGEFIATTNLAGIQNKNYGQTPLVTDLNNDGYPDLILINLNGKSRAFLNNGGAAHYVKISFPDTSASIGARATLTKNDGTKLVRHVINGTGFMSDQSTTLIFGLGPDTEVKNIEIEWLDARKKLFENITVDETLTINQQQ